MTATAFGPPRRRTRFAARPRRWPTPCSSRAMCSTRTAPRRPRTGCAGSSACSSRPRWGADSAEHDFQHTECLMEPRAGAELSVELRFLHAQRRTVQQARPGRRLRDRRPNSHLPDRVLVPWDEGAEERVEVVASVAELAGRRRHRPVHPARPRGDRAGARRRRAASSAGWCAACEEISGDGPAVRERTRRPVPASAADRDRREHQQLAPGRRPAPTATRRCRARWSAAHLLLGLSAGSFLSMTDPPEWAKGAVAACRNLHTWPVLAGEPRPRRRGAVLADHPGGPPGHRPGEPRRALRRHRDRRDPRAAHRGPHRPGEARGPRHRRPGGRGHRPRRLHAARGPGAAARRGTGLREVTGPGPAAAGRPGPRRAGRRSPDTPWWDPASDRSVDPVRDRIIGRRAVGGRGQPGAAATRPAAHRRPGPLPARAAPRRSRRCCTTSTAGCTSR